MNYPLRHEDLFVTLLEATFTFLCVLFTFLFGIKIKNFVKRRRVLLKLPAVKSESVFLGHLDLLVKEQKSISSHSTTQAYFNVIDKMGIEFQNQKEGCFRLDLSPLRSVVHLIQKETCDKILTQASFIDKSFQYDLISNWLGSSLLTSGGNAWKMKRKLLSRGFHSKSLQSFVPVIDKHAKLLCHRIQGSLRKAEEVHIKNPHKIFLKTSLDIILDATMAVSSETEVTTRGYTDNLHEYSILYIKRVSCPWLWLQPLYYLTKAGKRMKSCIESMKTFTDNIIRRRIQETNKTNSCLLDLVLESFELNEARNEVDTFIFAGHDTVSTQHKNFTSILKVIQYLSLLIR